MPGRKVATTVYLTPEQDSLLKVLHQQMKVPMASLVRQGVDMVLNRYADRLPLPVSRGSGRNKVPR